jgi:succinyl-CoA synthetase alpha subunit
MSILVDEKTRVVVQGITGNAGAFHTRQMVEFGTKVVAGVTPGKGGTVFDEKIPIFDTVQEAVERTGADCSAIFVPPMLCSDAVMEAADAGIKLAVCITEGIQIRQESVMKKYFQPKGMRLIGPNCPGLISPGKSKVGIIPGYITKPGSIGVVSRSGTLTYEAIWQLSNNGFGQSTCVGIGGDPVLGTDFIDVLKLFAEDDQTQAVVLIGEIGGNMEEQAAAYIKTSFKKPVFAFIAGRTAPPGKRMGHAGAIIMGTSGRAEDKLNALRSSGVVIVDSPAGIGAAVKKAL